MTVKMLESLFERMRKCSEASYPDECCGFLLGSIEEKNYFIKALREVENAAEDSRQKRYLISPTDFLSADNSSRGLGLEIIGVYHSHPDHPAVPSIIDRETAIVRYLYVILNVTHGQAGEVSGWIFNREREAFDLEDLLILDRLYP
jgi:proteasome lid subunit RPN8/RPN11